MPPSPCVGGVPSRAIVQPSFSVESFISMARRRLRASRGGNVEATRYFSTLVGTVSTAVLLAATLGQAQAPPTPAAAAGGRGGNGHHAALWPRFYPAKD